MLVYYCNQEASKTNRADAVRSRTGRKEKTMERYDYLESIKNDIREYLMSEDINASEHDKDELCDKLCDELWTVDSVTGNASGSYTCNAWEAEENLCHNLDLLGEALAEFGCGADYLTTCGAEAADVTIRCYLLSQAVWEVLDDIYSD